MNDWNAFSDWAFKGTVSIVLFMGWWAWTEIVKSVKEMAGKHSMYERHIAENYATKGDLNAVRIETLDGLRRVHDRIDEGNKQREANFQHTSETIRENFQQTTENISEIKSILIEGARKH